MSYSVTKNTSLLTAASILQKIISFVYFTIIARFVGEANTGQYFVAMTFSTIFAVVADFGLGPILTRETSRHPEDAENNLQTIFWTKIVFGLGAYLLLIMLVNLLGYVAETRQLIFLAGITMFFDNLHAVFYGVFRARKNLFFESIGVIGSQFITLLIGTIAIFLHWPLYWLIIAYIIPSFLNFVFSATALHYVYKIYYHFSWNKELFKKFLLLAAPFAIAGIINRLYSYSDTLLMTKMLSAKELGWWSVPYKITFAFQFIPVALSASVYPVFSSLYLENKEKIEELFIKSWRYLFTIVFPISAGLFVLAEPIIVKIYKPAYLPSVPVLKVLLISLIFSFLSFITGALLNATNRQNIQTFLVAISLGVSITVNLIFLPRLGIMSAAYAALLGNFLMCLGGFFFCARFIKIRYKIIFKYFNQTFWPALVMALAVYFLKEELNFLLTIPIGAAIYGLSLFATGGLSINFLRETILKIKQ